MKDIFHMFFRLRITSRLTLSAKTKHTSRQGRSWAALKTNLANNSFLYWSYPPLSSPKKWQYPLTPVAEEKAIIQVEKTCQLTLLDKKNSSILRTYVSTCRYALDFSTDKCHWLFLIREQYSTSTCWLRRETIHGKFVREWWRRLFLPIDARLRLPLIGQALSRWHRYNSSHRLTSQAILLHFRYHQDVVYFTWGIDPRYTSYCCLYGCLSVLHVLHIRVRISEIRLRANADTDRTASSALLPKSSLQTPSIKTSPHRFKSAHQTPTSSYHSLQSVRKTTATEMRHRIYDTSFCEKTNIFDQASLRRKCLERSIQMI